MYGLTLTAEAAEEPVTLTELKAWARVDYERDDALLTSLGKAARSLIERLSGRQLVTASWRMTLPTFPWPAGWQAMDVPNGLADASGIRLPKAPLQSVASVEYYDYGDVLRTLEAATYVVQAATDPGRITLAMNKVWPVTRLRPDAVRVNFVAGYGTASQVPDDIKLAIKMTVGHWYENREAVVTGTIATELPVGPAALMAAFWNGELEYGT